MVTGNFTFSNIHHKTPISFQTGFKKARASQDVLSTVFRPVYRGGFPPSPSADRAPYVRDISGSNSEKRERMCQKVEH
ncbi:hypothetical protein BGAL_0163g00210 [Botrytis galanthina]|uniref:Uncharacterized protein n=1 Tax=Botrytis galanthina TaxID=278940 RepID=A0A4S8QXN2_9HELO|nr:hypothetical protein BGAL_0163g00210 [Botrytis galanthina]